MLQLILLKYNAGFIISLIFIPQMVQAMGIKLYYRISNDTRDVLVVQSNYPVKDYFKVREICNDPMENSIENRFTEIGK